MFERDVGSYLIVVGKRPWRTVLYYRIRGIKITRKIYEDCDRGGPSV